MADMTMPIGNSAGDKTVRANMSDATTRIAPTKALPGKTQR